MGSISKHASAAQQHSSSESSKIYQSYLLDRLHQQLPDKVQLANQDLLTVAGASIAQLLHRLSYLRLSGRTQTSNQDDCQIPDRLTKLKLFFPSSHVAVP